MALAKKYHYKSRDLVRDTRPTSVKIIEGAREPMIAASIFIAAAAAIFIDPRAAMFGDLIFFLGLLYFWFLKATPIVLPFKLPKIANIKDKNEKKPGGGIGKASGIMYLGNDAETNEEIWFGDTDARTHMLYLGTTGSGKTVGLRGIATNALCWSSGFVFIDGKADTALWNALSSMTRRFGRDDDLLVMNYMTGNTGGRVPSNTLNPFSSGSASYLTNMLVSLMPDAEGDNAMWKDRAVALVSAMMPCLVWKRDNQNIPLNIGVIRKYMGFNDLIKLTREKAIPEHLRNGLNGYWNELPGFELSAYDDEGNIKARGGDMPQYDESTPRQQHGYLSMQFTRALQSLGDDYGFIFDTQAADIDMQDIVLQRRILVVLIPALEKSGDETANLGKIIASALKGMMGATLGHTIEGDTATTIDNKPTNSATPFIAIFDEVGYYTAQGMAVMAAQARSLGFCLVYAAQDLPALEKRVKEEARSIVANCNIKLFGKLEDPTSTKDFFEKTVGQIQVAEVAGFQRGGQGGDGTAYMGSTQANIQNKAAISYDELKGFNEGKAVCTFSDQKTIINFYFADAGKIKGMRVQRLLPIPPPSEEIMNGLKEVDAVLKRFRSKKWKAELMGAVHKDTIFDVDALVEGYQIGQKNKLDVSKAAMMAVASVASARGVITQDMVKAEYADRSEAVAKSPAAKPIVAEARGNSPQLPDVSAAGAPSWGDFISNQTQASVSDGRLYEPYAEDTENNGAKNDDEPFDWDKLFSIKEDENMASVASQPQPNYAEPKALSWASIIGLEEAPQSEQDISSQAQNPFDIFTNQPASASFSEDKNDQLKAMSWGDIIGKSEDGKG